MVTLDHLGEAHKGSKFQCNFTILCYRNLTVHDKQRNSTAAGYDWLPHCSFGRRCVGVIFWSFRDRYIAFIRELNTQNGSAIIVLLTHS